MTTSPNPAVRALAKAGLRPDRLLRGTRLLLWLIMAIAVVVGIAFVLAIPAVWLFGDAVVINSAEQGIHINGLNSEARLTVTLIGLGFLAVVGLAIQFLRKLIALIDSVAVGSPFIPENAARLRTMGWLVLAMQGLALLSAPLTIWIKQIYPQSHVVISVSLEGLITALLLFILARVFEQGTRLAEDVEGTV